MDTYELGSVVRLSTVVRDLDGNPTDATVALTITLPNASTATPTPDHDGTGAYSHDYTPSATGRYVARWVGSGAVTFVDVTEFWVVDTRNAGKWLTTTDLGTDLLQTIPTGQTATAQAAVDAAIAIVESYCDRRFTGSEPYAAAYKKVALRIAGDFYANPLTRDSFTGPESFTYTGSRGASILTMQEKESLDPFSARYGFA